MEKGNERNRILNFSTSEKVCLMNICKKYQKVLEDKQTNRTSIDDKNKLWVKIENEFNSQASITCYRSREQLKRLYANKKKELRRKFADHKKGTYITRGGPPPPDPKLDAADTILIRMINENTVSGFYSEFDSDNSGLFEPSEKRQKAESDTQIYQFDPADTSSVTECHDNDSEDNVPEELNKEENMAAKAFRKCPPGILQKPMNQKLIVSPSCQSKEPEKVQSPLLTQNSSSTPNGNPFNRRRPTGGVRALTSSDISKKYNILLDKRLALVEKQFEQILESQNYAREEQQYKIRMLKSQENLRLDTNEKKIKVELLQLEISYKKSLLAHDDFN